MAGTDYSKTVLHLNYTWKKKEKSAAQNDAKNGFNVHGDVQSIDKFDDSGVMKELAKFANVELSRKSYLKPPMSPMNLKRQQRPNAGVLLSPRPISELDAQMSGQDLDVVSTLPEASDMSKFRRPAVPPSRQVC